MCRVMVKWCFSRVRSRCRRAEGGGRHGGRIACRHGGRRNDRRGQLVPGPTRGPSETIRPLSDACGRLLDGIQRFPDPCGPFPVAGEHRSGAGGGRSGAGGDHSEAVERCVDAVGRRMDIGGSRSGAGPAETMRAIIAPRRWGPAPPSLLAADADDYGPGSLWGGRRPNLWRELISPEAGSVEARRGSVVGIEPNWSEPAPGSAGVEPGRPWLTALPLARFIVP